MDKERSSDHFLITGIGASAGGIQALKVFFENVPEDSGIAYVVILHLSPDYDSQLAAVLQQVTLLPVLQVIEKVKIAPNQVYVISPNHHLMMEDGFLLTSPNMQPEDRRAPVDIFFRTLAETHRGRAVCVVLSGTGANGSMGLKRVKERGGAVFVQNPREAEFSEMPRNAIATDLTDEILPVAEIPAKIIAYRNNLGTIHIADESEKRSEEQQQALREIFTQLRLRTGHDFSNYKRPTLMRRIERRINIRNVSDLPAYTDYIRQNPDEINALLKDLLISVTNFYRDKKAWDLIETDVLPRILSKKKAKDQLRIWVAGCATGEEAYSIAMLFAEKTFGILEAPKVQIFATDIDETAISHARDGFYSLNDAADVSAERLRRFFTKEGEGYRIRREVREMIMFAHHNFIKDPPFSHLDMITCRNVLIYLNHIAQERVAETFHFALNPGSFLFLGSSESVDRAADLYNSFSREHHIFQSRQVTTRSYPVPESVPAFKIEQLKLSGSLPEQEKRGLERISYGDLHQRLLEQYAPPSLVINQEYDIVHLSEQAGRYLQIGGGELSQNLLKLIRPELRLELRSALFQAIEQQSAVKVRALQVSINNQVETVCIHVRPVLRQKDVAQGFILVFFEPAVPKAVPGEEVLLTSNEPATRHLEEELMRMKAQLRSTIEQYEFQGEELKASNEELQAMNEELRSAAEELETSKEELQSINEEMRTVNQELKVKIEETTLTGNNLQNLINSANIGTIFLDRSFRVALFTPAIREIFNLIPSDHGRPITDITNRLNYGDLLKDAEQVLETLHIIEREVTSYDGRSYMMRLLPYRTNEDQINGVVITFFDITQRKQVEVALRESEALLSGQKEAFRTAMNGQPLAASLDILVRTAIARFNQEARAAFYIVPPGEKGLHLLAGMSEEYAHDVNGFAVGPESLACGLAMHTGEAVITPDIETDPRWEKWKTLARNHDYRACWSFPVRSDGPILGTFALYFKVPRHPLAKDIEFAGVIAHAAAIVISRDKEATERTQAETALRESEEQLRELVKQKEEFIGIAGHELRTPVTGIKAYTDLLLAIFEETGDVDSRQLMQKMDVQVDRLTNLVRDLLDTTKIYEQQLTLHYQSFSMDELLNECVEELSALYPKHPLITQPCEKLIVADRERIKQVVVNLISNAIKYSPEGSAVFIDCEVEKQAVVVKVQDKGIGIAPELVDKVFDRFFRVRHTKQTSTGMGLGLYIAAGIIHQHGGNIWAESVPEQGSVFSFRLPFKQKTDHEKNNID